MPEQKMVCMNCKTDILKSDDFGVYLYNPHEFAKLPEKNYVCYNCVQEFCMKYLNGSMFNKIKFLMGGKI
ncbi:MAG: hypothetical protein PHN89_05860 [Candidatus Pacebacteria bacterium]|nr:hypothetical protein [Candidatus Paceibacterota bacterium]